MFATRLQQQQHQQRQQHASDVQGTASTGAERGSACTLAWLHACIQARLQEVMQSLPVLLKQRLGDEGDQVVLCGGGFVPNVLPLLLRHGWVCHNTVCMLVSMLLAPLEQPPQAPSLLALHLAPSCREGQPLQLQISSYCSVLPAWRLILLLVSKASWTLKMNAVNRQVCLSCTCKYQAARDQQVRLHRPKPEQKSVESEV